MEDSKRKKSAEIINPGLGDIEKVRDILFGKYVAGFEARFSELEERLEKDINELMDRLSNKIKAMDEMVNQSIKGLDDQLNEERSKRDSDLGDLESMLSVAENKLSQSISLMEDQANQELTNFKKTVQESQEALLDQIEAQKKSLEADKVGRQSLALLLDEVAVKLRSSD